MATDIKEIDYDQIITKASNIAKKADQMQQSVKLAFDEINSMRENWFGNSYDNFIDTVNLSVINLNKLFETTVSDIPHEIAAKAKSYAASNQSTVSSSFSEQMALTLKDLDRTNKGTKLRFRDSEVKSDQKQININFQDAQNFAKDARTEALSLEDVWKSISGDTNIQELKSAFDRVYAILDKLAKALDNQISAQAGVIDALEGAAATVKGAGEVAANAVDSAAEAAQSAVNKIQQSASQTWTNLTGKN